MQLAHGCLVVLWAFVPPHAPAQQAAAPQPPPQQSVPPAEKPQAETPKVDPADLPVDLDRIRRALAQTPMLRFDEQDRLVFRVQVFGEKPTIEDILGPDFGKGPVPHGSMTHQEFLNMVTPKDVWGYTPFTNREGMTVAATSLLLQWTLQKAIQKYKETQDERAREAARQEVMDALNALEEARAKAGMPPK